MPDPYERYVQINLPHSRTVLARIGRMLEYLGALSPDAAGGFALQAAFRDIERAADPYDEDPAPGPALEAADALAARARTLVAALLATPVRGNTCATSSSASGFPMRERSSRCAAARSRTP